MSNNFCDFFTHVAKGIIVMKYRETKLVEGAHRKMLK